VVEKVYNGMASHSATSTIDQDDPWVFAMIEAVAQFPELWKMDDPRYRLVHTLRKKTWKKVADMVKESCGIEKTVEVLQRRWGRVMNKYRYGKKKPPAVSASSAQRHRKYADALAFMGTRSSHRRAISKLTPTNVSASLEGRRNGINDDQTERIISVLERAVGQDSGAAHAPAIPTSEHEYIGKLVVGVLDRLPNPSLSRQQAMDEIFQLIATYSNYEAARGDNK